MFVISARRASENSGCHGPEGQMHLAEDGRPGTSPVLELRPEAVDHHFLPVSWKSGDPGPRPSPKQTTRKTVVSPCMEVPLSRTIPLWQACPEIGAGSTV